MSEPTPAEIAVDAYVDLLLRGVAPSTADWLASHPEIGPTDRARLEKLARTLGRGAQSPSSVGDLPFESLGSYRLIRRLGAGGMGIVYEAEDARLGRRVALKVVRPELAGSADTVARFEREARAVAKLRHPNIVTVYEADRDRGVPYIAMEFVRGTSLDEIYAEARRGQARTPLANLLRWTRDTARALSAAHASGVVHRDVKPSNVRVTPEGNALLLDFGLALDPDSASISRSGQLHGTLFYVSPEQVDGRSERVDARTDVWSLGVMLYEGLTGRVPFEGQHSHEILYRILGSEPVAPRALVPELSRDVETVVLTALEKDRDRRYPSAAAFADDLDALLEGRPIQARPSGAITKAWKWSRRRPAHATAAGLALALVVGGPVAYAIVQKRHAHALDVEKTAAIEQRGIAEERARERDEQRAIAEDRAREFEQMAQFQGRVLTRIRPQLMGEHVLDDLRDEARAAWTRDGASAEELAARAERLEALLAGANATNVAVEALREDVLEPALASADEDFGDRPKIHGMILHSLAGTYWALGLADDALASQQRAYDALASVTPPDDRDTLAAQANLGYYLLNAGRTQEAERHMRTASEGLARVKGPDDAATLGARQNYAMLLRSLEKFDEAEAVLREVLAGRRRALGDDDPSTIAAIGNLGAALLVQDRRDEAEPLLREAYAWRRRRLGPGSESTLSTANNLGVMYRDMGRLADAETIYRESCDAASAHLGDRHPLTGFVYSGLAEILAESGCLAESESWFRRAIDACTESAGALHQNTLYAVGKLGGLLRRAYRFDEAEDVLGPRYRDARERIGETHNDARNLVVQYGVLLRESGRVAEAYQLFTRMHAASLASHGAAHERTQRYASEVARTYAAMKAFDEAECALDEARPDDREPSSSLVDAAVVVYTERERAHPSPTNAEAIGRWRGRASARE